MNGAPRVLVVTNHYLPGFRAGGPVRAIANTLTRLRHEVDFFVVTRDHDTDGRPYHDVESGRWNVRDSATVYYAPRLSLRVLHRCIDDSGCDLVWLNSFFARASLRLLASRRAGRVGRPVVLAPRGEFSPAALSLKRRRKAAAMAALRRLGCLDGIDWIASSPAERDEIARATGASSITCIRESVSPVAADAAPAAPPKAPGRQRAVFASRVDAMKNLLFLVDAIADCDGVIDLDIIGPIDDHAHWEQCRRRIAQLPRTITVRHLGPMPHDTLVRRLADYELMVLPTLGENFGHVVVEAWAAACPVLISDRTPWRDLAADGVGWDLPLERTAWIAALRRAVAMGADAHDVMRRQAQLRAHRVWRDGAEGDAALRQLIVSLTRADHRAGSARGRGSLAGAGLLP
jgi:glycosyltransferase involved in cell wall biosynthesis